VNQQQLNIELQRMEEFLKAIRVCFQNSIWIVWWKNGENEIQRTKISCSFSFPFFSLRFNNFVVVCCVLCVVCCGVERSYWFTMGYINSWFYSNLYTRCPWYWYVL
jgi:hypothetical protein